MMNAFASAVNQPQGAQAPKTVVQHRTTRQQVAGLWPEVPTFQQVGVNGYDWYGAWVKAGTSMPIIEKLREPMLHALDE